LIGTLAICGIPPFAGFWSKDEILGSTFAVNPVMWAIAWGTAGITAFYMFRMYFSTFEGSFRGGNSEVKQTIKNEQLQLAGLAFGPGAMDPRELTIEAPEAEHHDEHHSSEPHESPISMTLPLMILAIPSMLIGLVGTPFANYFEHFIHAPGEAVQVAAEAGEESLNEFLIMGGNSVGIALIGITLASLMYLRGKIDPSAIAEKFPTLYRLSKNKWYFDEIYNEVFVQGSRRLARQVLEVDSKVVDGVVNLAGLVTLLTGEGLKYFESGRAQFYALIIFVAVLGLVVFSGVT
jgi:NAD(P)H-quinone oxidoreductase subunit 5